MRQLIVLLVVAAILLAFMTGFMPVGAQPPHRVRAALLPQSPKATSQQCGAIVNLTVVYAHVDNLGMAPRAAAGSETQFNCIAARDPNFINQRFSSSWEALNYWFILYSQELGVNLQPLPAPTQ